jgi:hypothetical protein
MISGAPADPQDGIYCVRLAQSAVHAAMAGKTATAMDGGMDITCMYQ